MGWVTDSYPEDNTNVARTLVIQDKVAATMARWVEEGVMASHTLYGISLLNEPAGWVEQVWSACTDDFYPGGYHTLRQHLPAPTVVNLQGLQVSRRVAGSDAARGRLHARQRGQARVPVLRPVLEPAGRPAHRLAGSLVSCMQLPRS